MTPLPAAPSFDSKTGVPSAVCPGCGHSHLKNWGRCRPPLDFGGLSSEESDLFRSEPDAHLFRCSDCTLVFRFPAISDEHLQRMYANLPKGRWQYQSENVAWTLARDWLQKRYTPLDRVRILDVGAFDGAFLKTLPSSWDRQAIEPSAAARAELIDAGILTVAEFLTAPEHEDRGSCDVVTLFDVFEHLPNPAASVMDAIKYLKPGGNLIISTGNCDHWSWRFLRTDHWYCVTSQHMSFASPPFFRRLAARHNLVVGTLLAHSHQPPDFQRAAREAYETVAFTALRDRPWWSPVVKLMLKWPGLSYARHKTYSPYAPHLRDHLFVVLQKPA